MLEVVSAVRLPLPTYQKRLLEFSLGCLPQGYCPSHLELCPLLACYEDI